MRKLSFEKNSMTWLLLFFFLIVGWLVSAEVRNVLAEGDRSQLVSDYREAEQALQQLRTKNDQLLERNQTLLAQRDALLRESAEQDGPFENMDELNQAQLLAGLTDVEGDGVVVILRDKSDLDLQKDSALAIVHKKHLNML